MGKSIGKKVMVFVSALCVLMVLMCVLNAAALDTMLTYNAEIFDAVDTLSEASTSGDAAAITAAQAPMAELERKTTVKIDGTLIFNWILLVAGIGD